MQDNCPKLWSVWLNIEDNFIKQTNKQKPLNQALELLLLPPKVWDYNLFVLFQDRVFCVALDTYPRTCSLDQAVLQFLRSS